MKTKVKQLSPADSTNGHGIAPSEAPYRSQVECQAEGKRLRDAVPRAEHSDWKPPMERPDPVEMVLAQDEGRVLDLVPIRHGRMAQSAGDYADQAEGDHKAFVKAVIES